MNDQETQLVTIQVRRVEGEDKGHKVSEVTQEHLCSFCLSILQILEMNAIICRTSIVLYGG